MEYPKYDPLAAGKPLGAVIPQQHNDSWGDVFGAGFRQENDLLNLANYMLAPTFDTDPEFSIVDALRDDPLALDYGDVLGKARSDEELSYLRAELTQELNDKALLSRNGFSGFIASAVAGTISPTSLVPFAGPARGLKGMAQAFALAGGAVTAQEASLYGLQLARSGEEVAFGIAAGTVLGGLLGSAGRFMSPEEGRRVASDMAAKRGEVAILHTDPATGATVRSTMPTIRQVELPQVHIGTKPRDQVTVYVDGTEPIAATVVKREGDVYVLRTEDGRTVRSGSDVSLHAVDDPAYVLKGGDVVRTASPARLLTQLEDLVDASAKAGGASAQTLRDLAAVRAELDRRQIQVDPKLAGPKPVAPAGEAPFVPKLASREEAIPASELTVTSAHGGPRGVGAAETSPAGRGIMRYESRLGKFAQRKLDQAADVEVPTKVGRFLQSTAIGAARAAIDPIGVLAKLNPLTRSLENKVSETARAAAWKLQNPGVLIDSPELGPQIGDGTVHSRQLVHWKAATDFIQEYDDAYARHVAVGPVPEGKMKSAWLATIKSGLGMIPAGKLDYKTFGHEVFVALNTGKAHPAAEVGQGVAALKKYFQYMQGKVDEYEAYRLADDPEAQPLYQKLEFGNDSDIQNYVHHIFNRLAVEDNMDEFLTDLAEHGEKIMQSSFRKSYERMNKTRTKLGDYESVLAMDEAQLSAARADVLARQEELQAEFGPMIEISKAERKRLRTAELGARELKEAMEEFDLALGQPFVDAQKELKQLDTRQRTLLRAGANLTEAQEALLAKAADLEALQVRELEGVARAGKRFEKQLARVDDEVYDAKLEKTWADFTHAVKAHNAAQRKLDEVTGGEDMTAYDKAVGTVEKREDRLVALFKQIEAQETFDRVAAQAAVAEAQTLYFKRIAGLNAKRAVREDAALQKAAEADPAVRAKWRAEELKRTRNEREKLEDDFEDKWREQGATHLHVSRGEANFKEQADADAVAIMRKITGSRERVVAIDLVGDKRGPQLQRTLTLPFEKKQKYLITDPERVVRAHNHTMSPDMEMYRMFGSVNGQSIFKGIADDFERKALQLKDATHLRGGKPVNAAGLKDRTGLKPLTKAKRQELNAAFAAESKTVVRDMEVLVDRLRHSRGVPENPNGFGYRIGRVAQNANVFRLMGTVVPSSLPDIARPVMKYGLKGTFHNGWAPFFTDLQRVKMTRAEAYRAGVALEPLSHNRSQQVFDVGENYSTRQTMVERGMEMLANKTGLVAMFDRWTAENQHVATSVIFGELSHALRVVVEGGASTKELAKAQRFLTGVNLDNAMAQRIWKQYLGEGGSTEFKHGFRLPNSESWTDVGAVMAMRASVSQAVRDVIVTPGLDRPSWVDENAAFKLVAQFRSFNFTATNRVIMSGLQEPDMALITGTIMSLALGALSYYTWALSAGGQSWEKASKFDEDEWIYEAITRSGLLGILSEGQRVGEQIPALNDWAIFGGEGRNSRRASSILGAVMGPSYGLAERLASVAQGLDSPTQSTLHNARVTMVPYQNVFYLRRLLDVMEKNLGEALDIPGRRQ